VVVLWCIVEFQILAEVDIQFLVVDTVYLVTVGIVTVVGIVEVDMGLVVMSCRKVELRYTVLDCPCFSIRLRSYSVNINGTKQHVKMTIFRHFL